METTTIILASLIILYLVSSIRGFQSLKNCNLGIEANNIFRQELTKIIKEYEGLRTRLQSDYDKEASKLRSEIFETQNIRESLQKEYNRISCVNHSKSLGKIKKAKRL